MAGGVSADMPDGLGVPMLCYAAEAGKTEVLKWLLDSNAYASVADTDGRGPLHYAAKGSIHRVEAVRETYDLPSLVNTGTAAPSIGRRSTAPQHPVAAQPTNGRRSTDDKGQAGVSLFQALKDVATAYANIIDLLVVRVPDANLLEQQRCMPVWKQSPLKYCHELKCTLLLTPSGYSLTMKLLSLQPVPSYPGCRQSWRSRPKRVVHFAGAWSKGYGDRPHWKYSSA